MVVNGPLRNRGEILGTWVPGRLGKPDPNPQSCDTDCSQSRDWDHQGCSGNFQDGQKGLYQVQRAPEDHPEGFPQLKCCGPCSGEIY